LKGISDFIGFLIILLIIVVVIIPILLYASDLYYTTYVPPSPNQEEINDRFVNITYVENKGSGYLYILWNSETPSPSVLNIYNYSNGEWILINPSEKQVSNGMCYSTGYSPEIEVELSYLNQIYYVYLEYNTSALVG